jgi:protein TonB
MRSAATLSVAIHFGLIAGAWVLLGLSPAVDEMSAESVSVDIISMDAFSESPSEEITASNQSLVSAGAEQEAMEVPETAEAEVVESETAEPVEVAEAETAQPVTQRVAAAPSEVLEPTETEELASAEVLTAVAETVTPIEGAVPQITDIAATAVVDTVAPSTSDPLDAVRTATISELTPEPPVQELPPALLKPAEPVEAVETASLAPVVEEEVQDVPVPLPRIVRKPVEHKQEAAKEPAKQQPAEKPKKQAEQPQEKPPSKQANLGNGGANEADSAATKKSGGGAGKTNNGGSAAVSKYPGLVQAKVARAAKRPKGASSGEAVVSFTVNAAGGVTRVALARSSGNDAVDQAALAAVNRAAPFPPIPADAGRSSWQFNVPIQFKK